MSIFQAVDTDLADMALAKEIGETLEGAYPGWGWSIRIDGGVLFIQSLVICQQLTGRVKHARNIGMAVHLSRILSDAKVRKREIIKNAGEFLERVNQKRGAITDDVHNVKRVEMH